jgi:hypothetical protein
VEKKSGAANFVERAQVQGPECRGCKYALMHRAVVTLASSRDRRQKLWCVPHACCDVIFSKLMYTLMYTSYSTASGILFARLCSAREGAQAAHLSTQHLQVFI